MNYNLFGFKWGSADAGSESGIVYWTGGVEGEVRIATGYSDDDINDSLINAFNTWEDVSGLDFEYTTNSTLVDLTVSSGTFAGSQVGEASWSPFSRSGDFDGVRSATVKMDTLAAGSDSDQAWAPYGVGGLNFYAVALHEIGHTIGLDHVSDPSEIMNGTVSRSTLGDGDIEGVQVLYGTGLPGIPAPPPPPPGDIGDDPLPPDTTIEEDDGGGGAGVGLIAGVLAAVLALLFGFGGGAVALAAGHVGRDDDEDEDDPTDGLPGEVVTHEIYLSDLLPVIALDDVAQTDVGDEDEDLVFL